MSLSTEMKRNPHEKTPLLPRSRSSQASINVDEPIASSPPPRHPIERSSHTVNDLELIRFRRKHANALERFLRACKYGDVPTIQAIVAEISDEEEERGGEGERVAQNQETPDRAAATAGRRFNLKLLLHSRGIDTLTGLQICCYYDQFSAASFLLELARANLSPEDVKALLEARSLNGKGVATALMLVSSIQICRLLIDAGAEIEAADPIGMRPLHYAASSDNAAVAAVLLRCGADVNAQDKRGASPLHWAAFEGYHYTAMMLLGSGASQELQDAQVRVSFYGE